MQYSQLRDKPSSNNLRSLYAIKETNIQVLRTPAITHSYCVAYSICRNKGFYIKGVCDDYYGVFAGREYRIPSLWKRVLAEFIDFLLLFMVKLAVTILTVEYVGIVYVHILKWKETSQKDIATNWNNQLKWTDALVKYVLGLHGDKNLKLEN